MRTLLRLVIGAALLASSASAGAAQNTPPSQPRLEGDWQGTLAAGGANLRLAFHVSRDASDALTATFDSLDQGAMGLRIDTVTLTGDAVRFELKAPRASFEGRLSADGSQITGTWMQGSASLPLVLTRGVPAPRIRPQEPVKPYPYDEQQVTYQNKSAGVTLAGTLTLPRPAAKSPAVILITGSGAEDRDETVFGHKPFLVLADHLTRNGIAVLRVDDRGVGGSSGNTSNSTSEDFAGDVLAGIEYLKTRPEIDPKKIGLVGHSEGGLIAPIAATRSNDVAFVVMMAGPGLPGDEILYLQGQAIGKAAGQPDALIAQNRRQQERIIGIIKTEKDAAAARARLDELRDELVASAPPAQKQAMTAALDAQFRSVSTPWFRHFVTYDPRPALTKMTCPVLALIGELDLQVPYRENVPAIEVAFKAGGNPRTTVVHLPGLNHLFQTATTGSPTEYLGIEETIAPLALTTITDWIKRVTG